MKRSGRSSRTPSAGRTACPRARSTGVGSRRTPNAKIAVFYQNDDYGKDYLNGLKQGLGSKANLIVAEHSYEVTDASYASQIAAQRRSGANTWVLLGTPTPTVRAIATAKALNWKPDQIVINFVAATDSVMSAAVQRAGQDYVNGAISTGYLKNPTNPKYLKDGAVRQYNQLMTKYAPSANRRTRSTTTASRRRTTSSSCCTRPGRTRPASR